MLHTESLCYSYPASTTLRLPDLHLPQGAALVLRGNSGSGKSTLLALAAGLLQASSGRISVAGQDLGQLGERQRDAWRGATVGFLPQRLHLSDALSVYDNLGLAYFAIGQAVDKAQILRSLDALGVADLAARRPSMLSGGQAQRVALARAVLLRPRIILADEPTASLDDVAARSAISLLVQAALSCQASLVVATHDARVLPALQASFTAPVQCHYLDQINTEATQTLREQL
jgi:putative ABC transport system ATP-binding protein